jgi:hypothetical protein
MRTGKKAKQTRGSGKLFAASSHIRGVYVARSPTICRAYADLRYPGRRRSLNQSCDWGGLRAPNPGAYEDQARSWSGRLLQHPTSRGVRLAPTLGQFTDTFQLQETTEAVPSLGLDYRAQRNFHAGIAWRRVTITSSCREKKKSSCCSCWGWIFPTKVSASSAHADGVSSESALQNIP